MIEPQAMPYETVFSWVTRCHLKTGIGTEKNTYQSLFNCEKVRIHAYLPSRLQRLDNKGGITTQEWLFNHSLYPLFQFFRHDLTGQLYNAMLNDRLGAIYHAHTPHSKLNFSYGHKVCPICAKESRKKIGFAYYDIRFQIPGVEVCPMHGCYLHTTVCGDYGLDKHLSLPRDLQVDICDNSILIRFSQFCFDVLAFNQKNRTAFLLLPIYRKALLAKGFITKHQHLRMASLISSISAFYQDFSFTNGWEGLHSFHFLGPLLWNKSRGPCHPAKHLLFAFWLFDGDVNRYNEVITPALKEVESLPICDDSRVTTLIDSGLSMEQVSTLTGKSRCYIRRRCELIGVKHKTNDNAFTSKVRHQVLIQAQLGRHRQVIAEHLNVGVGYVEQVIGNTLGLSQWRTSLRILKRVIISTHELENAIALHPKWLRKDIKMNHSKAFFYLYNHARDRLEDLLPVKAKSRTFLRDWSDEDDRLYQLILNLDNINSMSFTAIAQSIHDRGHLRKKMTELPKSRSLLISLGKYSPEHSDPLKK